MLPVKLPFVPIKDKDNPAVPTMTRRYGQRLKLISGAVLLLFNSKTWHVVSKASDIDFLVHSIEKAKPHMLELVSVIKDWGWLVGVALLFWAMVVQRYSTKGPTVDRIKVRATQTGYYGEMRRRQDDVFTIKSEQEFSSKWMERVPLDTPETQTTSAQALRRTEAELRGRTQDDADEIRISNLQQALSSVSSERDALIRERDTLKGVLEETQQEREALRGKLGTTNATLAECMADVALWKLERLSKKYRPNEHNATVTVRFIDFSDGSIADRVKYLFDGYTQWATKRIRDDGSDIRQPNGMARVMFESGTPEVVRELSIIFNEGNLLKELVSAREIHERDDYDVVVTIFPRDSSETRT